MTTPNATAPTATSDTTPAASSSTTTVPGDGAAQVTAPSTADGGSAADASSPTPSAADVQREKLLLLREKRRAMNVRQQEEALKSRRAEVDALAKKYDPDAFKRDPVSFLDQHGVDPVSQLDRLVQHTIESGTPEASIKKLLEPIAEENKALKAQIAKLAEREEARERAAQEAEATRRLEAVHQSFLKDLSEPTYAELRNAYSDNELIAYGEHFANALQAARRPVTFQAIATEILKAHREFVRRVSPKATEPKPASASAAAPPKTRTLTNSLDADVTSTVERAETPAEKIARLTRQARTT